MGADIVDTRGYTANLTLDYTPTSPPSTSIEKALPGKADVVVPFALDASLENTSGRQMTVETAVAIVFQLPAGSPACPPTRSPLEKEL
jgi:hypothetical protein